MNDEQLHRFLRDHPAQVQLPGSFSREVWARIEAEESLTVASCIRRVANAVFPWLARPVPATLAIALSLVLGAWLGARSSGGAVREAGALDYVESIHPLLQRIEEDRS